MKNLEKVVLPLTAGAAVLGIWLAFRKTPTVVQQSSGGFQLPPIPPLIDNHFGVPGGDYTTPAPAAGGGHTSDMRYIQNAAANPLSQKPGSENINVNAQFNPFAYLTFNGAPWDVFEKALTRQRQYEAGDGAKAGGGSGCGGCSGGCGGGMQDLIRKCSKDRTPRLMDGHGDCLTTKPAFENKAAIAANTRYVAASYDDTTLGVHGDFIEASAGTMFAATAGGAY